MHLFLKNLLFTLLVPGTVGVAVPMLIAGGPAPASLWTPVHALPVLVLGAALYTWTVWDFASFGRGTPAPIDAPKRLVVRGLYRYTRNPMYVGVLTVIVGWALWFERSLLVVYAVFVATCFNLFIRFYEEPHLRALFGAEFDAYCARVGRWFPRLGRNPRAIDEVERDA
jgi:protein-S-isoprenylcysteine O-methyltransferase Ste14